MIIYRKSDSELVIPCGLNTVVCPDPDHELQMKTIDSSTVLQDITPDQGYYGLYRVIVNPYQLDSKTVDASTEVQVVTSSKDGLFEVIVNPYNLESKTQTITQNGEYSFTPESADGISRVDISVNVADIPAVVQTKSVTYTENGEYSLEPDQGYDGLSHVDISVEVPDVPTELQDKSVDPSTYSITVEPDQGYDGLSSVTVAAIDSSLDPDLQPENIKKDVEIFGVTGTFEGGTLGSKTVDSSTVSQTVAPDSGDYGLSSVTVNPYTVESKSRTITVNGQYNFTPDNADALSAVSIDVSIDGQEINNQSKTVDSSTTIQYVQPDQGYTGLDYVAVNPYTLDSKTVNPSTSSQTVTSDEDGLSSVTVNAVTAAIDPDLVPGNIKKDVEILGVVGTFEGGTLQSKSVNSSTSSQTVTPDGDNYGLSQVTVNPYTVESKSQTITVNGQYSFAPTNADALSGVNIDVSVADIPAVVQSKSVSYTANGQYSVTPDSGYDGLSSVNIDVSIDNAPELQSKTVNSSTSSQTVSPDQGYDGLSSVTVNPYSLENKTVNSSTSQQTISADNGYDGLNVVTVEPYVLDSKTVDPSTNSQTVTSSEDGLSSVTVNAVTAAIDPDLVPGNIKKDVEILGVTGTYEGAAINNQNKTVSSSTSSQTVTCDNGYTGLGTVTVNPYTLDSSTVDPSTSQIVITSSADGLSSVTVNAINAVGGSETITQNGSYTFDGPSFGADYLESLQIDVSVDASVNNQNKTVNPSINSQSITADSGYTGLGTVTFNAVTASIDPDIVPGNIKNGVEILGVIGTYTGSGTNLQVKSITANTTFPASIYPDAGYDGMSRLDIDIQGVDYDCNSVLSDSSVQDSSTYNVYAYIDHINIRSKMVDPITVDASTVQQVITPVRDAISQVTVNAVTSSIDPDIVAGNIKQGVTILGVTGSFAGGTLGTATVNPSTGQQVITPAQGDYGLSSVTVNAAVLDSYTVNSSTVSQTITPVQGHYGLSSVTVNPYTLDSKTVNPSTNSQTVNSSVDGLSSVTVNAVTASIDSNITAGNIKSGVTILGVQGTFDGGGADYDDIYAALLEI